MAAHRGTEKASAEAPRKARGAPEVLGAADPEAPVGAVLRRLPAMVFLTTRLWLRNRVTDRYFRVQEVLKHARVSTPAWAAGPAGRGAHRRLLTPVSRPRPSTFVGGRTAATGWPSGR